MPIDSEQVRRIARLARLELDDETVERFRGQLESILDHVAMIDDLDVGKVPPTSHPPARFQPWREDEPAAGLTVEEALRNAPDVAGDHFRVPRILRG